MTHEATDFQTRIGRTDRARRLGALFPGKTCGAEDCEIRCGEALETARKLNLEPVPFVQNFIVDKIAPEYGCSIPADCAAEILENMRCRFGFVRPETAVPFDDSKKIVAKLFVAEKTASKTGTCKKCLGYDGKIYHLPEDESKMPELPLHPHCKCHYVDLTPQRNWPNGTDELPTRRHDWLRMRKKMKMRKSTKLSRGKWLKLP